MKKYVLTSLIIGIVVAIAYYFWGAPQLYQIIPNQIFTGRAALITSALIIVGFILYGLIKLSESPDVLEMSSDKKLALSHPAPKKYLSRQPRDWVIGKQNGKYVCLPFSEIMHSIVLGGSGSNKTTTLENGIIENNAFAGENKYHAILATDFKPELSFLGSDESADDIKIINPTRMDSWGFNPFYALNDKSSDDDLLDRCNKIAKAIIVKPADSNEFFYIGAQNILAAAFAYYFRNGCSFSTALDKITDTSTEDLIAQIVSDETLAISHPKIKRAIQAYDGKSSDAFQDITLTMHQELSIFSRDSVHWCFSSENSKIATPNDLINGTSLYLAIPEHELEDYSAIFRVIISLCLKRLVAEPERTAKDRRPIWVILDEAAAIKIPDFNDYLERARSKNVQITSIWQSFYQLIKTYGEAGAVSALDCCKNVIVFSCGNTDTAEMLSKWTGEYHETRHGKSMHGSGFNIDVTQNESQVDKRVLDVADIKRLEDDYKVLLFSNGSWCYLDKAPYYDIKKYNDKSKDFQERNTGNEEL